MKYELSDILEIQDDSKYFNAFLSLRYV